MREEHTTIPDELLAVPVTARESGEPVSTKPDLDLASGRPVSQHVRSIAEEGCDLAALDRTNDP